MDRTDVRCAKLNNMLSKTDNDYRVAVYSAVANIMAIKLTEDEETIYNAKPIVDSLRFKQNARNIIYDLNESVVIDTKLLIDLVAKFTLIQNGKNMTLKLGDTFEDMFSYKQILGSGIIDIINDNINAFNEVTILARGLYLEKDE